MNFLLTFIIFYGINLFNGKMYHATTTVGFVQPKSVAEKLGFLSGDKIAAINGKAVRNWEEIQTDFYLEDVANPLSVTVDRNGSTTTVTVPKGDVKPDEDFGLYPNHMHAIMTR